MKKRLFGRIAGLSSSWIEPLSNDHLAQCIEAEEVLRREFDLAFARCVEAIYSALSTAPEDLRRLLLEIKRDCFNQRSIRRLENRVGLSECRRLVPEIGEVLTLEASWAVAMEASAQAMDIAKSRERDLLHEVFGVATFCRGLALASPELVSTWRKWIRDGASLSPRRARKAEESLLRYLCRSALKLSPYSTLTRVVQVEIVDAETALEILPGKPGMSSLVRVKRYLLDQITDLLKLHPRVRGRLVASLNPSLEPMADSFFRYFRTFVLGEMDSNSQVIGYSKPASIRTRITLPWQRQAIELLEERPRVFADLVALVAEKSSPKISKGEIEDTFAKWLGSGLMELSFPFPSYEPRMEIRLLELLSRIEGLSPPLIAELEKLTQAEIAFESSADPLGAVADIDRYIEGIRAETQELLVGRASLELKKSESRNYYEDVLESRDGAAMVRMSSVTASRILEAATSYWQLSTALEKRADFIATLGHVFPQRFAGRSRVPVLEVFHEAQDLLKLYFAEAKRQKGSFNPFDIPAVKILEAERERIQSALKSVIRLDDGVEYIDPGELASLARSLPVELGNPCGPCLFLQPADSQGRLWVANRIFEGGGRMTSRFNVLLEGEALASYLAERKNEATHLSDGRRVKRADLLFTRANTVNLHWPESELILQAPGEGLAAEQDSSSSLPLNQVYLHLTEGRLSLEGPTGEILPVFLSPLHTAFIPSLLRFLGLFGTVSRSELFFERRVFELDGAHWLPRQQIGDLVIQRKRWVFDQDLLPRLGGSALEDFRAIRRFRKRFALPEQVYVVEQLSEPSLDGGVRKPQYIDFRSPGLVQVFCRINETVQGELSIDEALPLPGDFPADPLGSRRAVEIMLEA